MSSFAFSLLTYLGVDGLVVAVFVGAVPLLRTRRWAFIFACGAGDALASGFGSLFRLQLDGPTVEIGEAVLVALCFLLAVKGARLSGRMRTHDLCALVCALSVDNLLSSPSLPAGPASAILQLVSTGAVSSACAAAGVLLGHAGRSLILSVRRRSVS